VEHGARGGVARRQVRRVAPRADGGAPAGAGDGEGALALAPEDRGVDGRARIEDGREQRGGIVDEALAAEARLAARALSTFTRSSSGAESPCFARRTRP
jgi:hypothetical protein